MPEVYFKLVGVSTLFFKSLPREKLVTETSRPARWLVAMSGQQNDMDVESFSSAGLTREVTYITSACVSLAKAGLLTMLNLGEAGTRSSSILLGGGNYHIATQLYYIM